MQDVAVDDEIWRDVPGFSGRYSVSNLGRVYSHVSNKFLKPGLMSGGHLSVSLGRKNSRCVHELVLTAFRGERPKGCEGRHLNGKHTDNRLNNLEWATRSRNTQDKKWHDGAGNYKLSPEDAVSIRAMYATGEHTMVWLSGYFGVSASAISNVVHRRTHNDC